MRTMPPTNDPSLPSFLHPAYGEMADELQWVWDVWHELKDCKKVYLPQEQKEPPKAYQNRLRRGHFDNRFTPAIKGFAGLLSEFNFTDEVAESIRDAEKNIDLQGNSIAPFLCEADELVLRDGGCGILIEYQPEDPNILSHRDLIESGRRPYLVTVDRRDILNWDVRYQSGVPVIDRVTIRQTVREPDGEFGTKERTLYRVLKPGTYQVWELKEEKGKFTKVLIDEGLTSLDRVPLIWYSISDSKLFESALPFMNLARLNIEHFQKRSSLNEVLHKINMPVPVRKGLQPESINGQRIFPALILGPNSVVDVPVEGDFYFAEPTGNAIAATQSDIQKLEDSMDRVALPFLTGGEAQKTATEVVLDTAQTQATLKGMAERKSSAVEQLFKFWTAYTGEDVAGSIEVNQSVLQIPPTSQDIQIILDAMGVNISRELGLNMLLQRRWLPDDTDVEKELRQTEAERPDVPLVNSQQVDSEANTFPSPNTIANV